MDYKLSQTLNHVNENNWDDDITANLEKGQFLAVTSNTYSGEGTREVVCQIMDLEAAPGGECHTNTGLYVRQDGENEVQVKLMSNGNEVDSNVIKYP